MKKEFFKLSRNLLVFVWISLAILTIFVCAFRYNATANSQRGQLIEIYPYSSEEDLRQQIEKLKEEREDALLENDEANTRFYDECIGYSSYVADHYVPYENLSDSSSSDGTKTMSGMFCGIYDVLFFVYFAMLVLPLLVVNSDYVNGTYKALYMDCKHRYKVLLKKYAVVILSTLMALGIVMGLNFILSLAYLDTETVIVYQMLDGYCYFSEVGMALSQILSQTVVVLFVETIIFSICVFIRPVVWAGLASATVMTTFVLSMYGSVPFMDDLWIINTTYMVTVDYCPLKTYLLFPLGRIIIAGLLLFLSMWSFEKRDL